MATNRLEFGASGGIPGGYIDLDSGMRHYGDGSSGKLDAGTMDLARRGILGNQGVNNPANVNLLGGNTQAYVAPTPLYQAPNQSPIAQKPSLVDSTTVGGASSSGQLGSNPYLQDQANALIQTNTQNFNRNVLPRIASQAMATGGYGGSRQGVIEANALSDLNQGNANALANLYGNQYNNDQNRNLGYYQAGNSYNLGLGNLGLGYAGLDRQINNDNQAWQQQGINNGLNIWDRLQAGNNTAINAGNNIQDTPLNYWQQFSQGANSIGQGYGTSTSSAQNGSNPVLGALGGAQLGSQVANWWNGGNSGWAAMPNNNVYMGTGSMGD